MISPEAIRVIRVFRALCLVVLSAVAISAFTPSVSSSAAFHTRLKKSSPAANETVAAPSAVTLWFTEGVVLSFTKIAVKNAAGVAQTVGAPAYADSTKAVVAAPVTGSLAAGTYTVVWSTASDDGHAVRGKFEFVVK